MATAADAAERLERLAKSDQYHGPSSDQDAELIRNWVLSGERTLDREVAR
jgi:hypothetical protein